MADFRKVLSMKYSTSFKNMDNGRNFFSEVTYLW